MSKYDFKEIENTDFFRCGSMAAGVTSSIAMSPI